MDRNEDPKAILEYACAYGIADLPSRHARALLAYIQKLEAVRDAAFYVSDAAQELYDLTGFDLDPLVKALQACTDHSTLEKPHVPEPHPTSSTTPTEIGSEK